VPALFKEGFALLSEMEKTANADAILDDTRIKRAFRKVKDELTADLESAARVALPLCNVGDVLDEDEVGDEKGG
jgi:hypothetical protein